MGIAWPGAARPIALAWRLDEFSLLNDQRSRLYRHIADTIFADMATPDNDVLETLGRPEYPAAVQWSEDNLVAVAAGPAVLVINPCQLRGPRGSTALPEPAVDVLQVAQYPATPKDSVTYASTYLRTRGLCSQRNSQLASSKLGIRCVCWSPLGCDLPGNTLLTSVTEHHQACAVLARNFTICLRQKL